ncbi:hypothetical protein vseg_018560 [Gypsophila vaccaria]
MWLPNTTTCRILSHSPAKGPTAYPWVFVSDLMNDAGGGWNENRVKNLLLPFEADSVLALRLSTRRPSDTWYWEHEKNGSYSVRSAYRLIASTPLDESAASSSDGNR